MDCKGVSSDDIKWSLDNGENGSWGHMLLLALGISAIILAFSTILVVVLSTGWEEKYGLLEGNTNTTKLEQELSIDEAWDEED